MNQEKIVYTRCEDCHGTGKKPDEMYCMNCVGTGWVAVFKEPTVLDMRPVQSSERRRFPRYYTDLRLKLRNQQQQEFVGRCIIVAEGGLGAILPHSIPAGSKVMLKFSTSGQETALTVRAVVRNQRGLSHGFEFVALTDSERIAIKQFCDGLMPQSDNGGALAPKAF